MKLHTIKTATREYRYYQGYGSLSSFRKIFRETGLPQNIFVIVDENVFTKWNLQIEEKILRGMKKTDTYILPNGEKEKSPLRVIDIISRMISVGVSKDWTVVAIGGGVTGDIGGYVASVYMRGIPLIHIPTTLLAIIDSSIGGKNGVNMPEAKNCIGTIYQPWFILSDLRFLETLPALEMNNGMGELLKYAYLINEDFFEKVSRILSTAGTKIRSPLFKEIVFESVIFKSAVVSSDESERGLRKILNLGHTFAHALESASGYEVKHGEAVVFGLVCALELSRSLGFISTELFTILIQLPLKLQISREILSVSSKEMVRLMAYDKKNSDGKTKFILVQEIGVVVMDVTADENSINNAIVKAKSLVNIY